MKPIDMLLGDGAALPERATPGSYGYDLVASETVVIKPRAFGLVSTAISLPRGLPLWNGNVFGTTSDTGLRGVALLVFPRSSFARRTGLLLSNGIGLVDADYVNHPVGCSFYNLTDDSVTVEAGWKIAQAVFTTVLLPDIRAFVDVPDDDAALRAALEDRGGGFGSTGGLG
jgi:dUTP pyrophosphatase